LYELVGLAAPWWVSAWPLLNLILLIIFLLIITGCSIVFIKFARLGIRVFNDYLEKNKR